MKKKPETNASPPDSATTKNVFLEIFVQPHGRGFMYRALAKTEWGQQITVEGYAAGSQKEVERVVQKRVQKVLDDQRKQRAHVKAVQAISEPVERAELVANVPPPENHPEGQVQEAIQAMLNSPLTVSYTRESKENGRPRKITYTIKPSNSE
ncbi:MAG: hypothetical protein JNN12_11230 [Bacteroidetes Order II. Incertae sedis bacterium]|nr:hypothetical protein [Bacteroidetes Order II. bacterium]